MKFSRTLYFFIAFILPLLSFGNDNTSTLFEKGNAYYAKTQYKDALATYQKIIDEGYQSAAVYFNMGNASYKNGDVSSALLYYEKAHKLAPGDEDINFNIRLANLKTTDKIDELPEFFLAKWWKGFILNFSIHTLAVISIVVILLSSGILALYFFTGSVSVKKVSFYVSMVFFSLGVLAIFIAGQQISYFDSHRQAIVLSSFTNVKSAPGEQSGTLFVLHDGTKVNVLDSSNGWMKIKLANGNEGWIKLADVKEI